MLEWADEISPRQRLHTEDQKEGTAFSCITLWKKKSSRILRSAAKNQEELNAVLLDEKRTGDANG